MRTGLTAAGVSLLLIAAGAFPGRFLPIGSTTGVVLAALWPYLVGLSVPAAMLLVIARRRVLAVVAALLAVVVVAAYVPLYVRDDEPVLDDTVSIRVLTASLRRGTSNAEAIASLAHKRADIVALQELTRPQWRQLRSAGIDRGFVASRVYPAEMNNGAGFWSRYPVIDSWLLGSYTMPALSVRLAVPGIAKPVSILVVHVANSITWSFRAWRDDLTRLAGELQSLAEHSAGGCVIVAGDFNSTLDMAHFRALLGHGFRDAASQVGAGALPTFPAHTRPVPPLFAIDHVLTSGCRASAAETVEVRRSDHRGLVVSVDVPRG